MSCVKEDLKQVDNSGDVLLKFHDISVKGGDTRVGMVFWDDGSTVCLIREGFAERLKIQGWRIGLKVQSAGQKPKNWFTRFYNVKLVDQEGQEH